MTAAWWFLIVGLLLGPLVMCCGWLVLEWRHERAARRRRAPTDMIVFTKAAQRLRDDLRAKRGKR